MGLVNKAYKKLSIHRQCELLEVSRSSYYYEARPETEENLSLMRQIDALHLKHPYYGVLRMRAALSTPQMPLSDKRIRRLMRRMAIEAVYPKGNLSKACKMHLKYPYLLRDLHIEYPNQVWSTDITYVPMKHGFMYLCAVIDWHSRYILSWKLSNTLSAGFCVEALEEAVQKYGRPDILNTDQGSQFSSDIFTGSVSQNGIRLSMDGKGRATDNIAIERFWRSIKYENIYLYGYDSSIDLYRGIKDYIRFYNDERKHQGLEEQTPAVVYFCQREQNVTVTAFTT